MISFSLIEHFAWYTYTFKFGDVDMSDTDICYAAASVPKHECLVFKRLAFFLWITKGSLS